MQLGIDFDGTIVRFLVVIKSGACDGVVYGKPFESFDAAKTEAKRVLKQFLGSDMSVRIVELRTSYKRAWEDRR